MGNRGRRGCNWSSKPLFIYLMEKAIKKEKGNK